MHIYDPIAGGVAVAAIDMGSNVRAGGLQRPGKRARRGWLATQCHGNDVRIFDPVAGGEALLVLEVGGMLKRWLSLRISGARLACGSDTGSGEVRIIDPVAGGEALLVLEVGTRWPL